ncbi:MAG: TonB-dependent receptor, partial [Gemmatimonadaceae bacterium]|nr:TonB-dependent receptor [Gemmatimonadaceae bacterium]
SAAWTLTSSEHHPRSDDGPDTPADTLGFYGFFSQGTVTRRTADLSATWRSGAAQSVTLGAEVSRDHERSSTLSLSEYGRDAGTFVAARNDRALYLQAIGRVLGRGTYQLGGRLDDNSAFGTFRTARLAGAWRLSEQWQMRAAAGTAFRAPSFFENFATGYVRGNPALAPERTHSREAAIEGRVGATSLSVTAYQQRFRDLIQYNPRTMSPMAPNYVNVAGANADGAEAELSFVVLQSQARVTYALVRTRVTDAGFDSGDGATFVLHEPLMRRPERTARVDLSRAVGTRATVALGVAYTGEAQDRDYASWPAKPVTLPAHTLVDLSANVRVTGPGATVPVHARLRGENLTGVEYQSIFGFRAPGRTVRVGVTIGRP